MFGLPLHPAIVHLPLALAVLIPLAGAAFLWAWFTGRVTHRAWVAMVALQALLLGTSLLAINTGQGDGERVEKVVQESAIEHHEEAAELFAWAAGATLVLATLVLVFGKSAAAAPLAVATLAATVVVGGLGLRVGHAGGQLVYAQGAASAYAQPGTGTGTVTPPGGRGDDDDERERPRR
ncbi:MAG: hypothetical protein ABI665_27675 [Vicinamibacterales bacterium]